MEELNLNVEESCFKCDTVIRYEGTYCTNCGYPIKGTEKEQSIYHAKKIMEKNQYMEADKKVRSARNVLYVMAGLAFVYSLFAFYAMDEDIAIMITYGILSIMYLILGFWASKKPLIAILLGLLLYLTTIAIYAVADPSTIISGILFKVIIIAYLVKGVYSAASIKKQLI